MIHFRSPDDGDKVGIAAVRMDRRSSDEVAESKDGRLFTRYSTALCSVLSLVHASQAEHCRRKNRPVIAATKSRRVKMDGDVYGFRQIRTVEKRNVERKE